MSESIQNILKAHFSIKEEKADHHYRTELPNIIFELPLDAFEFRVYAFIKKIAGDSGGCWMSKPNLSKECGISKRKVDECIIKLCSPFEELNGKSLLTQISRENESNVLIITDIWRINGDYYRENSKKDNGCTPCRGGVHDMQGGGAQPAPKEEPSNKISLRIDDGMKPSVSKLKILFLNGTEQELSKEDLYSLAVTSRSNWGVSDIEYLYGRLETYDGSRISDLKKLCDKILANKSKADRAEKYAGKEKSKEKPRPSHESIPVKPSQNLRCFGDVLKEMENKKKA
jgi:hypothetical protein